MDRSEYRRIEEEVDRQGRIDEEKAQRLVAVAQGADVPEGDVRPCEALDLLVRAYVGRALGIVTTASARLPYGVTMDETRCLELALEAVRRAVEGYDPARGDFTARCARRISREVAKYAGRAKCGKPDFVSIEELRDREFAEEEAGSPLTEAIIDPRWEVEQERIENSAAVNEWTERNRGHLALTHHIRAPRVLAPRVRARRTRTPGGAEPRV